MAEKTTWQCQGRQEHGQFGSGKCPDHAQVGATRVTGSHPCAACDVEHAAEAAVGLFSGTERKSYESWLRSGGLARLQKSVAAWEEGAFLSPEAFRIRYFGTDGSAKAAALAHDTATTLRSLPPGAAGNKGRLMAAGKLVELVRAVRQENFGRVLSRGAPAFPMEFTPLSGTIPDPSDGATHIYSPVSMPKLGESGQTKADIGGGLEQVPGVQQDKIAVKNYRPSFVTSFTPKTVRNVDASRFKFYKQPDDTGKVR